MTIIAGEKDRLVRPSSYDGWLHALPEARFVPVPQCGHMSMLVRPDLVNSELALLVDRGRPAPDPLVAPPLRFAQPELPEFSVPWLSLVRRLLS
jgi:hypothetical protein